jgi:anti-sigma factor RsiW
MSCEQSHLVHRYHDGELATHERAAVEAHLRDCAECRDLLAQFVSLSSQLRVAPLAEIRPMTIARIRESFRKSRDRGVLRLAEWMSAAAAAILIAAILTWPGKRGETASADSMWQTVAVTPPSESHDNVNHDLVVVAQWMADDLSTGETH